MCEDDRTNPVVACDPPALGKRLCHFFFEERSILGPFIDELSFVLNYLLYFGCQWIVGVKRVSEKWVIR